MLQNDHNEPVFIVNTNSLRYLITVIH